MDPFTQKMIEIVATPLIAAGLAALGLWLSERSKDRNASHRRRQAVIDENSWVAYLKLWLEADGLIGGNAGHDGEAARAEVRRQLSESRSRILQIATTSMSQDEMSPLRRAWDRAVLYPIHRPTARAVRWVYWISLGLWLLFFTFMMSATLYTDMTVGTVIIGVTIGLVPLIAVSLPLALWVQALEAKAFERPFVRRQGQGWQMTAGEFPSQPQPGPVPYPVPNSYNQSSTSPHPGAQRH